MATNPKLRVEIEADIKGMESALSRADALLKQHQNNYKNVQTAISGNTARSRELEKSIQSLNNSFKAGAISEGQFAKESDRLSAELREVSNETNDYQRELRRLDSEMDRVAASTRNYQKAAQSTTRATNTQTAATGRMARTTRANAVPAMTSFSQVVQDAPYGIQGVANNIQQLTMQMGYLSTNAGGARGALKAMGATLMGPTGILLGVSLVTTLLVSYGDEIMKLISTTDELADATKEFAGEARAEVSTLNALLAVARNENNSEQQRLEAIRKINDEYGDYFENLTLDQVNTAKVKDEVDNLTESLIKQARVRGAQALIEEQAANLARETMEARENAERYAGSEVSKQRAAIRDQIEGYERLLTTLRKQEGTGAAIDNVTSKIEELQNTMSDPDAMREGWISEYINKETKGALKQLQDSEKVLSGALADSFSNAPTSRGGGQAADVDPVKIPVELDLPSSMMSIEDAQDFLDNTNFEDNVQNAIDEANWKFTLNQAEEQFNSLAETTKDKEEEISKTAQSVNQAFQGMVSGMINSMIQGEFKAEDFAKNILSSLASIALTSILGPAGGIFGGLFSGGGQVPSRGYAGAFASGGVVGGTSNVGDKLWARVNSGELILNTNQQKALYSQLNTPMVTPMDNEAIQLQGSTRIDGQDLIVVYERATKRKGRTT